LKSGDLINLGRIQLRFRRRAPAAGSGTPAAPAAGATPPAGTPDQPAPVDGLTEPYRPLKK
jgi:hypothetical protein